MHVFFTPMCFSLLVSLLVDQTWWLSVVSLQLLLSELGIFGDTDNAGHTQMGRSVTCG